MRQAVVTEPGKIVYREVPRPEPGAEEVLLRIARIGICGSDVHVFEGKHPLVSFPLVQGHEFSGTVEAVGERVTGLRQGDLVTVEQAVGCGECDKCAAGLLAQCERMLFVGGARPGAGGDFLAMEASHVVKMPPGVDADDAAMVEPLAVAVHAVRRPAAVAGKRLLILGGGTIGNLTAQVARACGAGPIVLVDKIAERCATPEVRDEFMRTFQAYQDFINAQDADLLGSISIELVSPDLRPYSSFAFVADVVIAEPGALIGFAGPRVIEQTVREKLPEGFQRAEFLLEKGAIDMIVDRRSLRDELPRLLALLTRSPAPTS